MSQQSMWSYRREVLAQSMGMRGIAIDDDMLLCIDAYVVLETHLVGAWIQSGMARDPRMLAHASRSLALLALCITPLHLRARSPRWRD